MPNIPYVRQLGYDIEDLTLDRYKAAGVVDQAREALREAEDIYENLLARENKKRKAYLNVTGEEYYA